MKIALIGASGQLGQDFLKVIPPKDLIPLNYPAFDITKKSSVQGQLAKIKPTLLINTAAYNLVDRAEQHPREALAVNYHGVANLADICLALDLPLVHFSTDYVFGADRGRQRPYSENDLPAPINEYGRSKLLGEQAIRKNLKKYFLIRTAYLFGAAGSEGKGGNIVESLINQASSGDELKVAQDQIISPTYSQDLARQTWALIQAGHHGLFHAVSIGETSLYDFAKFILSSLKSSLALNLPSLLKIKPVSLAELKLAAPRPLYSALVNQRLTKLGINIMSPWQSALKAYLAEKGYFN